VFGGAGGVRGVWGGKHGVRKEGKWGFLVLPLLLWSHPHPNFNPANYTTAAPSHHPPFPVLPLLLRPASTHTTTHHHLPPWCPYAPPPLPLVTRLASCPRCVTPTWCCSWESASHHQQSSQSTAPSGHSMTSSKRCENSCLAHTQPAHSHSSPFWLLIIISIHFTCLTLSCSYPARCL